jgi:hypothetical protein
MKISKKSLLGKKRGNHLNRFKKMFSALLLPIFLAQALSFNPFGLVAPVYAHVESLSGVREGKDWSFEKRSDDGRGKDDLEKSDKNDKDDGGRDSFFIEQKKDKKQDFDRNEGGWLWDNFPNDRDGDSEMKKDEKLKNCDGKNDDRYDDGSRHKKKDDSKKNKSKKNKSRNKHSKDKIRPKIILNGSDEMTIEVFTEFVDPGADWNDNKDGSGTVKRISGSVDTDILGDYILVYSHKDKAGNTGKTERTVHVVDTAKPVISLVGGNSVDVELSASYADAGATALDNYYGDITEEIVIANPVNPNVPGSYIVTYDVTDGSGNAANQVTRTVNVVSAAGAKNASSDDDDDDNGHHKKKKKTTSVPSAAAYFGGNASGEVISGEVNGVQSGDQPQDEKGAVQGDEKIEAGIQTETLPEEYGQNNRGYYAGFIVILIALSYAFWKKWATRG